MRSIRGRQAFEIFEDVVLNVTTSYASLIVESIELGTPVVSNRVFAAWGTGARACGEKLIVVQMRGMDDERKHSKESDKYEVIQ